MTTASNITLRWLLFAAILLSFFTTATHSSRAADGNPEPAVRYLEIARFFTLPKQEDASQPAIMTMMWKNDRLWLGVRDSAKSWDKPEKVSVRSINLDNLTEEQRWHFSAPPPVEHWLIGQGGFFDVSKEELFAVMENGKLRVQSLTQAAKHDVETTLPAGTRASVQVLDNRAYVFTDERVLELDPAGGSIQIIASKRRRPAANVLDNIEWIKHPRFIPENGGKAGLFMSTQSGVELYSKTGEGNAWTNILKVSGGMGGLTVRGDGLLYRVDGDGAEIRMMGPDNVSTLYSTTQPTAGKWEASPRTTAFPADSIHNSPGNVTASQTNLWVLMGPYSVWRSPFTTPGFILPSRATNSHAVLWYFDQRWKKPLEIPLRFPAVSNVNTLQAKVTRSFVTGGKPQLLATPKGLIIAVPEQWPSPFFAGFCFIPQEQLDAWLEQKFQDQSPAPMTARHEGDQSGFELHEYKLWQAASSLVLRYDLNQDKQLDEDELLAGMNKGLRSELHVKFIRFNNNVHELMVGTDGNKDGKLDVDELAELLSPRFIAVQYRPKPWDSNVVAQDASEEEGMSAELKARYPARVQELADLLNKAGTYDPELAKTLSQEYLMANDARKILELWKAYVKRTKPENRSVLTEDHLLARSYSLGEVKDYFATATSVDGRLLTVHILARNPTVEEALQIKPVFLEYLKEMKLSDKFRGHVNALDKAINGQPPLK